MHYNFLSKFVHPGFAGIEVWENTNRSSTPFSLTYQYKEEIYRELIFLYASRLMHLFLKVYLMHYGIGANSEYYQKYRLLVDELDELSKDLWFFENEPTDFDRQISARRDVNKETQHDIRYYYDSLRRLHDMRNII